MRTYAEVDRWGTTETRAVEGTPEEVEETLAQWSRLYGPVRVLDKRGKVERVVKTSLTRVVHLE